MYTRTSAISILCALNVLLLEGCAMPQRRPCAQQRAFDGNELRAIIDNEPPVVAWLNEWPYGYEVAPDWLPANRRFPPYYAWLERGRSLPSVELVLEGLLARQDARVDLPLAARMLGTIGDARGCSTLIVCLESKDPSLRREASAALGQRVCVDAVASLNWTLLHDEDDNVRANAASALGRIGGSQAELALESGARDRSEFVATVASGALRSVRGEKEHER